MFYRLKWTMLPILVFLLLSTPGYSSSPAEPAGQILGGTLDAPVRIEVFSNFECTHCREYYLRTIKKILKEYCNEDKVCIIYHDFPFKNQPLSWEAARYTEAASKIGQDTLLKVFDAFYTHQATWIENGDLKKILQKELTKKEFEQLMENAKSPEIESILEGRYDLAVKKGLNSTPTSFIVSPGKEPKKAAGIITYIVLKSYIDGIVK